MRRELQVQARESLVRRVASEQLGLLPDTVVSFRVVDGAVEIRKAAGDGRRGQRLLARMRGRATTKMTTDEIMAHTFQDRLNTIQSVQQAGMDVCCGGIIGMGETVHDRLRMLEVLTNFDPAPESVPINCLMAMPGTPMEAQPPVEVFALVRLVATTRIALPKAKVRLSAGRTRLSREAQALCFFAGANSIFYGDKLLTAANPGTDEDRQLLAELDLTPQPPRAACLAGAT